MKYFIFVIIILIVLIVACEPIDLTPLEKNETMNSSLFQQSIHEENYSEINEESNKTSLEGSSILKKELKENTTPEKNWIVPFDDLVIKKQRFKLDAEMLLNPPLYVYNNCLNFCRDKEVYRTSIVQGKENSEGYMYLSYEDNKYTCSCVATIILNGNPQDISKTIPFLKEKYANSEKAVKYEDLYQEYGCNILQNPKLKIICENEVLENIYFCLLGDATADINQKCIDATKKNLKSISNCNYFQDPSDRFDCLCELKERDQDKILCKRANAEKFGLKPLCLKIESETVKNYCLSEFE